LIQRILRSLLIVASCFAVAVTVRNATVQRPLDATEATVLEYATRFAQGQPAYAEPAHPESEAMMPGLPLAVSVFVRAAGPDIWEPRIVALLSILLCLGLVMMLVRLETRSWTLAITSAGFLALGLNLLAPPPDVARPEMVMMPFVLAGFFALRLSDDFGGPLLSAVAFTAAFFVAPQALWFVAAAMFALAIDSRQRLLVFTLVLAILAGGGYVLLSNLWGPWFNVAAWGNPLESLRWNPGGILQLVGGDLLGKLGVLTLAAVLSFALPTSPWRGKGGLWMCLALAALAGTLVATQVASFNPAAATPCLVALAVLGPVSMQRVLSHLSAWPGSSRLTGEGVVLTALALQFVMFFAAAAQAVTLAS